MRLAPLTETDLEAAADLWTRGWADGHLGIVPDALVPLRSFESFRARLWEHRADTTLAFEGDRLLGFFLLIGDALDQFYVAPEARGTGVATDLMRAAEAALAEAGHESAWLGCTVGNARAARFYDKMGWQNVGTETYEAFTHDGPFPVEIWRFEKTLTENA